MYIDLPKVIKSSLSWDFKERVLSVCYRNFGTAYRSHLNVLKPTGHVMHQQFNIHQLYALPTLFLCVLYLSENKQRLVPLTA